jgi:hypothetical protein
MHRRLQVLAPRAAWLRGLPLRSLVAASSDRGAEREAKEKRTNGAHFVPRHNDT